MKTQPPIVTAVMCFIALALFAVPAVIAGDPVAGEQVEGILDALDGLGDRIAGLDVHRTA